MGVSLIKRDGRKILGRVNCVCEYLDIDKSLEGLRNLKVIYYGRRIEFVGEWVGIVEKVE